MFEFFIEQGKSSKMFVRTTMEVVPIYVCCIRLGKDMLALVLSA